MFNESTAHGEYMPYKIPNETEYATAVSNTNPYYKFLAPEAFANIGFVPNSATLPPPPPSSEFESPLSDFDSPSEFESSSDYMKSSEYDDWNRSPLFDASATTGPPATPKIAAAPVAIVDSSSGKDSKNIQDEVNAFVKSFKAKHNKNNNEAVIESTPLNSTLLNNVVPTTCENDTSSSTNDSTISNNNLNVSSIGIKEEGENNNSIIAPNITVPDMMMNHDSNESVNMNLTPVDTATGDAVAAAGDALATTTTNENSHHLRKITPQGLPSIIKQAIEFKDINKIRSTKKFRKLGMPLKMPKNDDQPPETPSIESAPQKIDFALNENQCTEQSKLLPPPPPPPPISTSLPRSTPLQRSATLPRSTSSSWGWIDDFNFQSDHVNKNELTPDNNEIKVENIENGPTAISSIKDDSSLQEYNSANYWYVSPDIPLDLDELEKEGKRKRDVEKSSF